MNICIASYICEKIWNLLDFCIVLSERVNFKYCQPPLCRAALNPFIPDNWYWKFPQSKCWTFHLALLNFTRFTQARPSTSRWHPFPQGIHCTTYLGVVCKLAGDALDPTVLLNPIPLMKTLNIPYLNNSFSKYEWSISINFFSRQLSANIE